MLQISLYDKLKFVIIQVEELRLNKHPSGFKTRVSLPLVNSFNRLSSKQSIRADKPDIFSLQIANNNNNNNKNINNNNNNNNPNRI